MNLRSTTRWIYSPYFDITFIIGPAFLITSLVLIFHSSLESLNDIPLWAWVVLVMGIDVAHVYSTLFRTYFDKDELSRRKSLYLMVPILCWVAGIFLYSISAALFWSVLAYIAVWHFIRQQYGFMMIYRRDEAKTTLEISIDQAIIYLATIYPLIFWHTHPRNFQWFIEGDFLSLHIPKLEQIAWYLYVLSILSYLIKEAYLLILRRQFNLGKNLIVLGTTLSWYVGIVRFNGDMIFTMTNIVSHGIPYIALIWIFQYKRFTNSPNRQSLLSKFFTIKLIPAYIGLLFLFSYIEEWVWDNIVWHERLIIFGSTWKHFEPDASVLLLIVPLLAVPQATHYVLDAFIWRVNREGAEVRKIFDAPPVSAS